MGQGMKPHPNIPGATKMVYRGYSVIYIPMYYKETPYEVYDWEGNTPRFKTLKQAKLYIDDRLDKSLGILSF